MRLRVELNSYYLIKSNLLIIYIYKVRAPKKPLNARTIYKNSKSGPLVDFEWERNTAQQLLFLVFEPAYVGFSLWIFSYGFLFFLFEPLENQR